VSQSINETPRQTDFFDVCKECHDGCCTGVRPPLTDRRRRIIREYLSRNHICIDNPFENGKYVYPRETEDGRCIFLDRSTKRCRIHPVKPETCVAGPVTFDINAKTGKIDWSLKTDRLCGLAAHLYKNDEAYAKHLRRAKREIRRLIQGLDEDALHAILIIEEPDTIKVGEDVAPPRVLVKLGSRIVIDSFKK